MIGRKRFWEEVSVTEGNGIFGVTLDGRPLRTPEKHVLAVPSRSLADAIAAEWAGVEGEIQPDLLPYTRAANSAIDRISAQRAPVVDSLAAYGDADLLCYRADGPAALQDRQAEQWDPWLDWSEQQLSAPLVRVNGIMHRAQPSESLDALRKAVDVHSDFELTAFHDLVTLSGSLVLALAVSRGVLEVDAAWRLSRLDEIWQAEQWGKDHEAEQAAQVKGEAFLRAARLLSLLRS
ncbi:MAG: ATP12 family protein [Pseudomonadota bacterium]